MCGIVGWVGKPDFERAERMCDLLSHRGPDDKGDWRDAAQGVWLGQRRLAILDLSPEGHQPMASPSGRYVITYNGEVYNYLPIREELETRGFTFRGHSDTEVLLAAIEAWGLESAFQKFAGMFAVGLWDREERCLWLVRDRIGIKPLYYAHRPGELAFASELHALKPLPWLDQTLDSDALHAYLRYLCVPAPATILRGARKLMPGEMLRWDHNSIRTSRYWDVKQAVQQGQAQPFCGDFRAAADELESRLREVVRAHMISDVPLGAFLSGGIDSSAVIALMQAESNRPVKTFSIGFTEESHDESPHARAVAAHLGTEHHEHILTPAEVIALIPTITALHDEPFADNSSVPTYLVSRFACEQVTVAISGDGGDELFGGYPRYFWSERIERLQRRLTPGGARLAGQAIRTVPAGVWDGPMMWVGGRRFSGSEGLSARIRRLGGYLACRPEQVYEELLSAWPDPTVLLGSPPQAHYGPDPARFADLDWAAQMMATDQENYMVDDILTKVDRTSMAVSLEVRPPLLDHRIVEWSWRVPLAYKLAPTGDRGKLLLREVLYRYVPKELIERPKKGFGMPLGRWLRKELRPWAEDLLTPQTLAKMGVLDPAPVLNAWREHLAGADRLPQLWTVLMLQEWQAQWRS